MGKVADPGYSAIAHPIAPAPTISMSGLSAIVAVKALLLMGLHLPNGATT